MAAYAALVSLMHIIEQIQHHPRPPITLDEEQAQSLIKKVAFLQDFLEVYDSRGGNEEVKRLKSRIADAAYAAEDVIESHIVDQIHQSANHDEDKIGTVDLYQGLQKVIQDMDLIERDVVEIKDKMGIQDQLQKVIATTPADVSSSSPSTRQNIMVGFDDARNELVDKLIRQQSESQIIPIVGMGGIGKTTLARNVFEDSVIVQHFDVCYWVTISPEYSVKKILSEILCQKDQDNRGTLSEAMDEDLGLKLYQSLSGRRYLVIMDDMWSIEAWNKVRFFFPDNNIGSRILVTTRLSKLASDLVLSCEGNCLQMSFLDPEKSWSLLSKTVFGEGQCLSELEHIGMEIAQNCKGLPLSIVLIGGLLAKSKTQEYWEYIAKKLNSDASLEENESCLKILRTSYDELPIHLKPCFLYLGTFPEDSKIRVTELIKLWVAEGFLKPIKTKSLEESAAKYIMDLIDRNLILVSEYTSSGNIKFCNIHDLVRELCLREAREEKFFYVTSHDNSNVPHDESINTHRRIVIRQSASKEEYLYSLRSASVTRSLTCYSLRDLRLTEFRLLRVLQVVGNGPAIRDTRQSSIEAISQLVNSRYLMIGSLGTISIFPPSFYFWNLQTLIVNDFGEALDIWKMPLLKHVEATILHLLDPPSGQMNKQDDFVLWNLLTIWLVPNFNCSEQVVERIPNVKKLKIAYWGFDDGFEVASHYCLNNLDRLHKLESLRCFFINARPSRSDLVRNLNFPHSLKELTLFGCMLKWKDMSTKIGSLPLLKVLKLYEGSFTGPKWETIEGQFPSLKYLLIKDCPSLKYWTTESDHFPCLEHLILQHLEKLKEIPSAIGEIAKLQSIRLEHCRVSAVNSAKRILDEQEELGNEGLQVHVDYLVGKNDEHMRSLESHNFHVTPHCTM